MVNDALSVLVFDCPRAGTARLLTATGEYACLGGNDIDADMNVLKLNVVLKATLFCVSQAWSGIFWLLVEIPFLLSLDEDRDLNRHR